MTDHSSGALTPANENSSYCLATLNGEQPGAKRYKPLADKNRIAWNRWTAGFVEEADLILLAQQGVPAEDILPFSAAEVAEFRNLFAERTGKRLALPSWAELGNFEGVEFSCLVDFSGFLFKRPALFKSAAFRCLADFRGSTFCDRVDFQSATFSDNANLISIKFSGAANFRSATFSTFACFLSTEFASDANFKSASFLADANFNWAKFSGSSIFVLSSFSGFAFFRSTTFSAYTSFESATFSKSAFFSSAKFLASTSFDATTFIAVADFRSTAFSDFAYFIQVNFSGYANFGNTSFSDRVDCSSATFSAEADFLGTKFGGRTRFVSAIFRSCVPDFRGATMHEATEWDDAAWPLPAAGKDAARQQVYGYQRLKQEMERLKKHEDELLFFRKELRAKRGVSRTLSPGWCLNALYDLSSSYGQSIGKPLMWLAGLYASCVLVFAKADIVAGAPLPWRDAASLSFANAFAFLSLKRDLFEPARIAQFSRLTFYVSAAEAILATTLLFLFGLALRNRFRIK